jgi:hypothetical protein
MQSRKPNGLGTKLDEQKALNEGPVSDTGSHRKPALFRQVAVKVLFNALAQIIKRRRSFFLQKALSIQ